MEKYTLTKPESKQRDKFIVTIVADSNDADYITTENTYSKEEFEETIADALVDLQNNYGLSYQLPNYYNEHDLDIPYNGWDGYCHTLKYVQIQYIDNNGETWDVNLKGLKE
jgi:hypothetical protein